MPRLPRIIIPNFPHHITQRGNRRQQTFFDASDYHAYLDSLHLHCKLYQVKIWAYCLMPNHVHLILIPSFKESLTKAVSRTHETYTRYINFKMKWRGYLWQGRYSSFPMDEHHLYNAIAYVELNPVRAGLVQNPKDYQYSSAPAHFSIKKDPILSDVSLLKSRFGDWNSYLERALKKDSPDTFYKHEKSGKPMGSEHFLKQLEQELGLSLIPKKPGRKPKNIN